MGYMHGVKRVWYLGVGEFLDVMLCAFWMNLKSEH